MLILSINIGRWCERYIGHLLWCVHFLLFLIMTASFVVAHAGDELDKAIDKCVSSYRSCYASCNRKESDYVNKKEKCKERQDAEDRRHEKEMDKCDKWIEYRKQKKKVFSQEIKACASAACRDKAQGKFSLQWNASWFYQSNCEQIEGSTHETNQYNIDVDCIRYDDDSTSFGRECRDSCVAERKSCVEAAKSRFGDGGGAGMRIHPCPRGTTPNPLGQCILTVITQESPDTDSDPCPAGFVRGPRDACVPKIRVIGLLRTGEDWYIVCPEGMRPSPDDGGCIVDTGTSGDGGSGVLYGRDCPPGSIPGARDDCVLVSPVEPGVPLGEGQAEIIPTLEMEMSGMRASDDSFQSEMKRFRMMKTDDPARAIQLTRERLESR